MQYSMRNLERANDGAKACTVHLVEIGADMGHNGLWKVNTDGSGLIKLISNPSTPLAYGFCAFLVSKQ